MRNSFKVVLVALAPVVSVAAMEIGFRWRAHELNRETFGVVFSVPPEESRTGRVRFLDIIRPHPNDRIIYELRANLDVEFKLAALTTNSHGFRGPEYPVEAEPVSGTSRSGLPHNAMAAISLCN